MINRLITILAIVTSVMVYLIFNYYSPSVAIENVGTGKTPKPIATIAIDIATQIGVLKKPAKSEIFDFDLVPKLEFASLITEKNKILRKDFILPPECDASTYEEEDYGNTEEEYIKCRKSNEVSGLKSYTYITFGDGLQLVSYEYETSKYIKNKTFNDNREGMSCKSINHKTLSGSVCFDLESEIKADGYIHLPSFTLSNSTNATTFYITPTEIFRPTPDEINLYYNIVLSEALGLSSK